MRLYQGTGSVKVNGRELDEYFGLETLKLIVRQPLTPRGPLKFVRERCRGRRGRSARPVPFPTVPPSPFPFSKRNRRPPPPPLLALALPLPGRAKEGKQDAPSAPQFSKR